jgi:hypothetical protein
MTALTHARRLVSSIDPVLRAELAADPASAITRGWPLTVTPSTTFASRGSGGWCDGMSILDAGIILYRPTGSRRENFTLLHELAHHLVDKDDQCLSWLADLKDPARTREQVCDQVAAMLLLPSERVEEALAGGRPTAGALLRLYHGTQASRSACAVALTGRLPCDGFVAIIERETQSVFFAARARDTRPYAWRDDPVPAAHPLRRLDPPTAAVAWWPYPDGERRQYFMSTSADNSYTYAVFAELNLWGIAGFHIPQEVREDRGYSGFVDCASCGYKGSTRSWPCRTCGQPPCPRCEECDCDRQARRVELAPCGKCWISVRSNLLVNGLCPNCR